MTNPSSADIRIHERIDKLTEQTTELIGVVRAFEASCGPCRRTVARHDHVIFGNGDGGLARNVTRLQTNQKTHGESIRGAIKFVLTVLLAAATALVTVHFG